MKSLHQFSFFLLFVSACYWLPVATALCQPLAADAGPTTAEVCDGNGIVLGGSPTVEGGSGFYMIDWSSNPPGFSSNSTNPVVIPTETTTYTVSVMDSDGDIATDEITVTVNPATDPADLDILFNPASNAYSIEEGPVDLTFTVSGGGGSGTFSGDGVNSTNNKFYPNAGNSGPNDITLTYTNADDCITEITETVSVYDPNGFIGGLDPSYCPYGTENLTVNIPPPYTSFIDIFLSDPALQDIPAGTSWTKNIAARTVQLDLAHLPIGRNTFRIVYTVTGIVGYTYTPYFDASCLCIRFNITPVFGPIQTNVLVPLIITAQPEAKIAFKSPTPEFCRNATPLNMEGAPVGGTWFGTGVTPAPGNDNNPAQGSGDNGIAEFNPSAAGPGVHQISYLYENNRGCRDTAEVVFTVFDVPVPNFTAGNGCVGIPMEFNPAVNVPPGVTLAAYNWDFDDESRETGTVFADPTFHTYSTSNDYDVTFSVLSTQGCTASVTRQISIGDIPDLALAWSSVCEGDPTRFELTSAFFNNSPGDVARITWDFGDATQEVQNNPGAGAGVRFHTYASNGSFMAEVTMESDLGCSITESIPVYKVARTEPIFGLEEYLEDFNAAVFEGQQWISGGENNSWEWGFPANTLIDDDAPGGGKAWVTNLDGSFSIEEKSWVHSPCVNLAQIERPVVSLDIRSLMRSAGAVLQANVTTSIDNGWVTVGALGEGANWYNESGLSSNPGNQLLNQYGWSGRLDSTEWRRSVYPLDNVLAGLSALEKSRVRFRIAFSSENDAAVDDEGFAFDNVRIAQRDRIVLLETFTNSGGINITDEDNKVFNNTANLLASSADTEIAKLAYHVGFEGPGDDPLYGDNPVDANARAAYYGVSSAPYGFIDGTTGPNLAALFNQQTLKSADAIIDAIETSPTPAESLNVSVTFTAKSALPPNTTLHIAVVERVIDAPEAQGSNGETSFRYVMKKMLPSALGTVFPDGVEENSSHTVNVSWMPQAYRLDELAIVAFLQDENTGTIFQAARHDYPAFIPANVITGLEPDLERNLKVFPVPADQQLHISLPSGSAGAVPLQLVDGFGRTVVSGAIGAGERAVTLAVSALPGGMYTLEIPIPGHPTLRKKVMVVHR